MKKLLLIILLFLVAVNAQAQKCNPDTTLKNSGIYPRDIPAAIVNLPYTQVVNFVFPKDTTISSIDVTVDSARIIKITGFPQGFSYECDTPRCSYLGGGVGCITITGTPASADIGNYWLKVEVLMHANSFGWPLTATVIDSVPFEVALTSSSFSMAKPAEFKLWQNHPNPFSEKTFITFYLPKASEVNFSVFDLLGNEILSKKIMAKAGNNSVTFYANDLPAGFYFYHVKFEGKVITRRMMIKKE